MNDLYGNTTIKCSRIITRNYSTSFSLGISTLQKKYHAAIYAIYGFVRCADEIVDTFHEFDKHKLLKDFREDTYQSIAEGISMNPVLHSFQWAVNKYSIDRHLIESFLESMEMDLYNEKYSVSQYKKYIYGSAEVVGLMCLKVFSEGDVNMYNQLEMYAKALGSAFQKVNFLRDVKSDLQERGRIYFPEVNFREFTRKDKLLIEKDIENDFSLALEGIKRLPKGARSGVYLAYIYYINLFTKIKNLPPSKIMEERIRIADLRKFTLLASTYLRHQMNYI